MSEGTQRRLAAIVLADVVGYSRLMGADETGTLEAMRALRQDLWDPTIERYGGRVVNRAGDSALSEFASAVAAMECSVAIQTAMAEHNRDIPEDKRIALRVGVNIGEVIVDGGEIYGDGVNIAARLQTLAQPGGIALSGNVQEQIRAKLDLALVDDGEHVVKNIAHPVRVWRWSLGVVPESAIPTEIPLKADEASLALPDKASIAVLPFDNMSGDPEQEYFSDGITEDIITALSHIRQFFVVARNTTFTYKGGAVDVQAIARDLGVRYVLEGSVRRSSRRVRITAQLIDGQSGKHLWADRYDRDLKDIFAVQDEITQTVVGAILPELSRAEQERARRKPPESMDAWDCYQRGLWHAYKRTKDDYEQAEGLFNRAVSLDPNMSQAYAGLVETFFFQIVDGYVENRDSAISEAISAGRTAVDLDSRDAMAHYALGRAYTIAKRHEEAVPQLKEAINLNPSLARAYYALGFALVNSGHPAEGIPPLITATQLSPHDPTVGQFMVQISRAYLFLDQYEEALTWAREALRQPNIRWTRWTALISALGHLGRLEEAAKAVEAMHRQMPEIDFGFVERAEIAVSTDTASRQFFLDGLRKAGFTD